MQLLNLFIRAFVILMLGVALFAALIRLLNLAQPYVAEGWMWAVRVAALVLGIVLVRWIARRIWNMGE